MKKYSFGFILLQIVILFIISCIPAVIVKLNTDPEKNLGLLAFILTSFTVYFSYFLFFANPILFPIAKRTMEKKTDEEGIVRTRTFYNKEWHSCASVLVIDETHAKIAYVSAYNPFKFQVADVKDLSNIRSSYIRGPFGGTRYVYYQFTYKKKRTRIPTFTSRQMFMLESAGVQNAIIKANRFYDSIESMQKKQTENI